jgi:hypothetical protein
MLKHAGPESHAPDYRFFYEVRANLRREQIRLLAAGGMRRMRPGIESLKPRSRAEVAALADQFNPPEAV